MTYPNRPFNVTVDFHISAENVKNALSKLPLTAYKSWEHTILGVVALSVCVILLSIILECYHRRKAKR